MRSRRDLLRMAAGSAGVGFLPASIRRALAIPPARVTGTIHDVEHVVILMQENRSFDHYYGTLRGVRGFGDPRPVRLPNGSTVWHQPPAKVQTKKYHSRGLADDATHVLPFYLNPMETTEFSPGTDHGWSSGHLAWNHGHWNEWVNQKQDVATMGYLRRNDLQFHYALAEAFTLCDAYHCSVHSKTAPNRIYLWTGTVDPRNAYGTKSNGPGMDERPHDGYTWTTYPERLEKAGVSWRLYQGGTGEPGTPTDNYTDNSLEFFAKYQVSEGASPHSPLVQKGVVNRTLRQFREDVVSGRLPQVSWIVAPHMYSEHPEACPSHGAVYINTVLEALTANPAVWARTVLLLNYDENDGQFDHVVPPMPPLTSAVNAQGMVSHDLLESLGDEVLDLDRHPENMHPLIPGADPGGRQPIGLGPRVPMTIVSPWTTGGWVCSQTFDHTSVLQFLEQRFGVEEPQISAWRRAVCGDLTSAFDFASPPDRAVMQFPMPKLIESLHKPYNVPSVQSMPVQEPGARRSRALPYELAVNARLEKEHVWVEFANTGHAGAGFYVYDRARAQDAPRRYTVSAGDTLSDCWNAGREYALDVHGPNGLVCEFRGEADKASAEARVALDRAKSEVVLSLTNAAKRASTFVIAHAYGGGQRTVSVAAGATVEDRWNVEASARWYDLSVRVADDRRFLRRFAGHLENRAESTSDPATKTEG